MTSEKKDKVLYWLFTLPIMFAMTGSSIAYLSNAPQMLEGMAHLGYPVYLLKILGAAKLLGVFSILYGRINILKEWAYAGFTINLVGASASHAFSGDSLIEIVRPIVFLTILLGSYVFWKKRSFEPSVA